MSNIIKPIGPNVLIKIKKRKSTIELLPGTSATDTKDLVAVVEEVGTSCKLGIRKGHEILMPAKMSATIVEQTDDYDLIIIPESVIPGVKNWSKDDSAQ
jgi:co-chaperonin GroES (HSP10)